MTELQIAKFPGMCAHCGKPIYVGDKIRIVEDMEKQLIPTMAYHDLCFQNKGDWE